MASSRVKVNGPLQRIGAIVVAAVIAGILLDALHNWDEIVQHWLPNWAPREFAMQPGTKLIARLVVLILATAILAWVIRRLVRRASRLAMPYVGVARAQVISTFVAIVSYLLLIPLVAYAADIDITGLAVPGALTGVVIGIAAQASLGNVINGLVILFTRPYMEGMSITARSPLLVGGEYSGLVTSIGLFYTVIRSGEREVRMPNSAMAQSTVIVRPDPIEVYVPVVLAPSTDYAHAMDALREGLAGALPPRRIVSLILERIDAAGYTVGVHASVASLKEEQAVAAALARITAGSSAAVLPPSTVATTEAAPPSHQTDSIADDQATLVQRLQRRQREEPDR